MRILAVGCHPDDLEIGCGGTLARYAAEGHTVICCHVANGDMGHVVIEPEPLGKLRAEEAREAGRALGVEEVIGLGVGDLQVDSKNEELVRKVVEVVRYAKPDAILTHSENDYMRDHVEVCRLVFNASFSSSIPHYPTASPLHGAICPIYHMDTLAGLSFIPEEYVDVSGYIEVKLDALNRHQSQIKWMLEHDHIDFLDFVRTCSKYRGLQCGVPYAEGFRVCRAWPRVPPRRLLP